jgi:hypothetical protein
MKMNVFRNFIGCKFRGFGILLAACLVFALLSCNNPSSSSGSDISVTVNPPSAVVYKGGSGSFSATVNGTNNPAVTWTVEGGVIETRINSSGTLTVASNESATTLTVRATSTVDISKSGTATVTVKNPLLDGPVIINGTPRVGYSLTANTEHLQGRGIISYQWKWAETAIAEGQNIPSATNKSYELVDLDDGKFISVTVSREGYDGTRTSDAVGPVASSSGTTGTVSGTVTVDNGIENVTVSFTNPGSLTLPTGGTLTVTVSGTYQAYQWFVDGVALNDEPLKDLVLSGSDYTVGEHRILVIVYKNDIPYSHEIRFTVN